MVKIEQFPYIRIAKMNELLKETPLQIVSKENEFSTKELAKAIGTSKSTVSNLIITLKSLNFVEGRRKFKFTPAGKKYAKFLIRNQQKEAKEILQDQVENIEYFQVIKQRLSQKGRLAISEIGNLVALQYDKKWENPLTLRATGAAISSILDFAGLGFYRDGILAVAKIEEKHEGIPAPNLGAGKIFKILTNLFPTGADIHTLSRNLKTKEGRMTQELACCIALGVIERSHRGFYKLTKEGELIISPYTDDSGRKMKFRERLVESHYKKFISKLPEDGITTDSIGSILEFESRRKWSETTKKTYGKKFLNWLSFSGIVEKIGKEYKLNKELIKEKPRKKENAAKEVGMFSRIDLMRYYTLGKSVGQIVAKSNESVDIDEVVGTIVAFCQERRELKDLAEDWRSDFRLFKDVKDFRIFLRDVRDLEKLMGMKR